MEVLWQLAAILEIGHRHPCGTPRRTEARSVAGAGGEG